MAKVATGCLRIAKDTVFAALLDDVGLLKLWKIWDSVYICCEYVQNHNMILYTRWTSPISITLHCKNSKYIQIHKKESKYF